MSILLENCVYIDWKSLEFTPCHLKVEEGNGGGIEVLSLNEPFERGAFKDVINCYGNHVTKSFAIGHHHAYSVLSRGMPPPQKPAKNFSEKLKKIWWELDKALDADSIRASALATAIFCARDGSTFVIDHHSSPNHIAGSLEIIADVFDQVGLSHLLCYEISDREGNYKTQLGLERTASYLEKKQGLIGLHASFTLGDPTLKQAQQLMQKHNAGIHIHVAEDMIDQEITFNKYKKTVVERLNDFGFLDSTQTILAHCLHLSEMEKNIIRESNAWVVENMESNLNNNVGVFSGIELGNKIMLGTDGMHSDMIRSAQYAYFANAVNDQMDLKDIYQRLRNVHSYLSENNFEGDGNNNLIILNYDGPTNMDQSNFLAHLIYGFHGGHVQHVISKGRLIVKDHRLVQLDEESALKFAREQSIKLWKNLI